MNCIPAIDIFEGNVVRLHKGRYEDVTRYSRRPRDQARQLQDAGIESLHVVDLNAARGDAVDNLRIVEELASLSGMKVQVAGGVRNRERLARMLDSGADRVVIGSLAVHQPETVIEWMQCFGAERIVPALDVRMVDGEPEVLVQGWQESGGISLWALLDIYRPGGMRGLLCTDVDRDGTLQGPNIELYRQVLGRFDGLKLQASGGVGSLADLEDLQANDIPAVIIGKAWLDERIRLEELKAVG